MRIRLIFAALAFVAIASCNPVNITLEFFPHSATDESRLWMLVNEINSMDLPWKAEYNELASLKDRPRDEDAVDYSDLKLEGLSLKESVQEHLHQDTVEHLVELASLPITLPSSFDAREKWAGCSSVHHIQDQGGCGSCWAAATTGFLSDRLCISSNFTDQRLISPQDLVSCCDFCGGCGGAWAMFPLIYWKKHGLVSGGALGSKEGCRPYGIPATCGGPCPPYYFRAEFTPKCERTCQPNYEREYQSDLGKGRSAYHLLLREHFREDTKHGPAYERYAATMKTLNISSTELIKREIFLNGPVAMETIVTEPFMHYRSGIYTCVNTRTPQSESLEYGHAMKLLGWGEENGEKYWIVANSWGRHWGEGGFGRISMDYLPHLMSAAAGLW